MEKKSLDFIQDNNMKDLMNHVFEQASGVVIELSAAPTTAGGELSTNQTGRYGNNLYKNINGTTYIIGMAPV